MALLPDLRPAVLDGGSFLTVEEALASVPNWASPGAVSFFHATWAESLYGGRWLVHSTQFTASDGWTPGRRWHVAHFLASGAVDSLPGSHSVLLEWGAEEEAHAFALGLERGQPGLERLEYHQHACCMGSADDQRPCDWATWLVNEQPLCSHHAGHLLEYLKEHGA